MNSKYDFLLICFLVFLWMALFLRGGMYSSKDVFDALQGISSASESKANLKDDQLWRAELMDTSKHGAQDSMRSTIKSLLTQSPDAQIQQNQVNSFFAETNINVWLQRIWLSLLLTVTWTWTNLMIMSCIASVIGEYGRKYIQPGYVQRDDRSQLMSAIIRGFFIYFALFAGQLIIAGTVEVPGNYLENSSSSLQGSYFRLAFSCSLFGFIVGYAPHFFVDIMNKFLSKEPAID